MRPVLRPTLFFLLKILRRLFAPLIIVSLLATNLLSLTSGAFQAAASGLLAAASIPTVHSRTAKANLKNKQLIRKAGSNIRKRTLRSAAVNVGSMAGEALPFVGWAVIVGATGYELKLACDNLMDVETLQSSFGIGQTLDQSERSAMSRICDPSIPSELSELSDWATDITEYDPETSIPSD